MQEIRYVDLARYAKENKNSTMFNLALRNQKRVNAKKVKATVSHTAAKEQNPA
jgi:hypothetical protein